MSTLVAVRIPDDLLEKMDARGKRSRVIVEALEAYLGGARTPPTAKASPEEIATPARKTTPPAPPQPAPPQQRPPIDASLPDYIEEPAPPSLPPAAIYRRPEHDADTCRSYGCLMCAAAKRT